MQTKKVLPITSARKNIFFLSQEVQKDGSYYTLTQRGIPRSVLISAETFENLLEKSKGESSILRDMPYNEQQYGQKGNRDIFPQSLIIRDESRVVYLSGNDQNSNKYQEESLIKAQLYVELFEKYKYPLSSIEFCRYVHVGDKKSRHYIEADIIINDERGNARIIFEVSTFAEYEKNLDAIVGDLFSLAEALSFAKRPEYLVCFSRSFKDGVASRKITTIECKKYGSFLAWKRRGRQCGKEVPMFNQKPAK